MHTTDHTSSSGPGAALRACFSSTIPVAAGYIFLGITYGILMRTSGFPWWLPCLTALVIYTGSMEFLMVEILLSSFHPLSAAVTALMIGARHLFYGLSMLGKYSGTGWKKFYLIYTTSDETFAVNYAAEIPEGIDRSWYYFWVSLLDQSYWVLGSAIGGIGGGLIRVSTNGLSFVMTAMFIVIFLSQWTKDSTVLRNFFPDHAAELIGVGGSVLALTLFGPDNFIVPAMIIILCALTAVRRPLERYLDRKKEEGE
jgi:4-azaleucine resistance transporter AzlC